jgi:hypothetical protein
MIGQVRARRLTPSEAGLGVGLASALVQLGPLLGRGFVLTRDMVFVPRLPIDAHLLGVGTVPRAVPSDLLVALASRVVPGDVVQDVILVAIITFAGWGAARLTARAHAGRRLVPAVAAAALYSWNPYLAEHLRQGQWAVLVGYAALPWVASTALALHRGDRRAGRHLFLALAAAAAGGASAELLAVVVAVPIVAWPRGGTGWRRRLAVLTAAIVVVSLPWLVPSLASLSKYSADRAGVRAFAARPDTPFGTIGSLLGLGGIWNAQATLPGHGAVVVSAVALATTGVSLWALWWRRPAPRWTGLVVAAVVGLALAAWAATPGVRRLAVDVASASAAGGLLRDGQRWLAPFVLAVAVGFGWFVGWAAERSRLAPLLAVVPMLLLPAAAWGSNGELAAVHWPSEWGTVAAASERLPSGPVLVLPWSSQRRYGWNGFRVLDDPTDRWLSRRVVGDDSLRVGRLATPLEDPLARPIARSATGREPLLPALRRQGYAGVLLQRDQPGAAALARELAPLRVVVASPTLVLYAVGGSPRATPTGNGLGLTIAADTLVALLVLISAASLADIRTRPG